MNQSFIEWSPDEYAERQETSPAYDERGFWYERDFSGRYINVKDGARLTIGATPKPQRIYMLGSSTTFGTTDDAQTIASYLQALTSDYEVVNLGSPGGISIVELNRTQTLDLHTGDIVIWFDGGQDAFNELHTSRGSILCRSAFIRLLACPNVYLTTSDSELDAAAAKFAANALAGRQYVESQGAAFYHFLQPHLLSHTPSAYEQMLLDNPNITPEGYPELFARFWHRLQETPDMIDLTHVLDEVRDQGKEVFYDHLHMNGLGDSIVAQAMFDHLEL